MIEKFADTRCMLWSEFLDLNHASKAIILVSLVIPKFARDPSLNYSLAVRFDAVSGDEAVGLAELLHQGRTALANHLHPYVRVRDLILQDDAGARRFS